MAVDKRTAALAILGLAAAAALVWSFGSVRADRADEQVAEILGEAEVEALAYLREAYRPIIRDVDGGMFWLDGDEIDVGSIGLDPRVHDMCDNLTEVELNALDAVLETSAAQSTESLLRLNVHAIFLTQSLVYAYYGALYDEGMVETDLPPPPYPRFDEFPDSDTFRGLVIQSSGRLDRRSVGETLDILPLHVLPECALGAAADKLRTEGV